MDRSLLLPWNPTMFETKGRGKCHYEKVDIHLSFPSSLECTVPTNHPNSFMDHVSDKEEYQCVHSWECVKITSVTTKDDRLDTKVEILSVERDTFNMYFLFAKGALHLKDEEGHVEEMNGINIGGYWFEY